MRTLISLLALAKEVNFSITFVTVQSSPVAILSDVAISKVNGAYRPISPMAAQAPEIKMLTPSFNSDRTTSVQIKVGLGPLSIEARFK